MSLYILAVYLRMSTNIFLFAEKGKWHITIFYVSWYKIYTNRRDSMNMVGHHHISMYTKDAKRNKDFYTNVLGLRLVEKSSQSRQSFNVSFVLWGRSRYSRNNFKLLKFPMRVISSQVLKRFIDFLY